MQVSVILIMIVVLLITVFTVVNAAPVSLSLVFTRMEVSLALIILISALLGALILFLIGLFDGRKKSQKTKQLETENFNLKQRITVLERQFKESKTQELIEPSAPPVSEPLEQRSPSVNDEVL